MSTPPIATWMLLCGFSSAKTSGPFVWAAFHAFWDVVFEKSV